MRTRLRILDEKGNNVRYNYNIGYQYGTLEVYRRPVQINPNGAEKVYDGTPLVNTTYTVSDMNNPYGGIAPEQSISNICFCGSQTDAGQSDTWLERDMLVIADRNGEDVTSNYEVYSDTAKLIVRQRNITIAVEDASKSYDGTPLSPAQDGYRILDEGSDSGLAPGHSISQIEIVGEQTRPGKSEAYIVPESVVIVDNCGVEVTYNYNIVLETGELTVDKSDGGTAAGDLDTSGSLSGSDYAVGGGDGKIAVVLKIKSEVAGDIYLKLMSFGDFDGKKWDNAYEYGKTLVDNFGFDYLTSSALKKAGVTEYGIEIQSNVTQYFLPYYMSMTAGSYEIQQSDVFYDGDSSMPYSLKYFSAYASQIARLKDACAYTEQEAAYREFVYSHYLSVPDSTRAYLEQLATEQGFDKSSVDVYEAVANYIQKAAKYNLKYDRALDNEDDIVVAFLSSYREGVCRHYASAATLLFRTLGIPARYTIGYVGQTKQDEWVDVSNQNGHAWVEVYMDAIGWVQLEVTGGGAGGSGGNGSGSGFGGSGDLGGGGDMGEKEITLDITPAKIGKAYDGTPLVAKNKIKRNDALVKLTNKGYTYRVEIEGSQTDFGVGVSRITKFVLLDPNGNDVTEGCGITVNLHEGEIVISKYHSSIYLYAISKPYDGQPVVYEDGDYEYDNLPDGYEIEFELESMVNAGVYNAEDIEVVSYTVYDNSGNDVTSDYYVDASGFGVTIERRKLEIVTGSATKVHDGKVLENRTYYVSKGQTLVDGDVLKLMFLEGSADVGEYYNIAMFATIVDQDGNDVTDNYHISAVWGTLTILGGDE